MTTFFDAMMADDAINAGAQRALDVCERSVGDLDIRLVVHDGILEEAGVHGATLTEYEVAAIQRQTLIKCAELLDRAS
ncbi:MAG: hypothetical protein WAU68_15665 [Vitreimonas sp.]